MVNDIYFIAWKRQASMPATPDEQILWLYAIGRRVIANKIRWKMRLDSFSRLHKPLLDATDDGAEDSDSLIMDILVELPVNLRDPLLLVEWEGLSVRDAAKLLKISESAMTKRLPTYSVAVKILRPIPAHTRMVTKPIFFFFRLSTKLEATRPISTKREKKIPQSVGLS